MNVVVNCAGIAVAQRVLGKKGPHSLEAFLKVKCDGGGEEKRTDWTRSGNDKHVYLWQGTRGDSHSFFFSSFSSTNNRSCP